MANEERGSESIPDNNPGKKKQGKGRRRARGEGSLHPRKDGRWAGTFTTDEGKRVTIYGKTQQEALEKLRQAQYKYKQGLLVTGPQQLMGQLLDHWLEEVHKPTIKLTTYAKYRRLLDNHIIPEIGRIQLRKLTPERLEQLYTKKTNEGLSASVVRNIHIVIHEALDQAVRKKYVAQNVSNLVDGLPRVSKYEAQVLTKEQAQQLLKALQGSQLETFVMLAITTGMRHGEMLALEWQDIDFRMHSLSIRRIVSRLSGIEGRYKGRYEVSEPKTKKSQRNILLPEIVLQSLKAHRVHQKEACSKAGEKWQDRNLVFCNTTGGYINPDVILAHFHKAVEQAGLPRMRIHDLRHSAATILLSAGAHPKLVQELLGHSSIDITMDVYSHVLPPMQRGMMDGWNDLLGE